MNLSGPALLVVILLAMGMFVVGEVRSGAHKLGRKVHIIHNCDSKVKQP